MCGESGAWEAMHGLPFKCSAYAACASPKGFIVSGGLSGRVAQAACHEYVKEGEWRALPPMPTARCDHGSIHHQGHLYIIGGRISLFGPSLDSVEMLNLESLQWSTLRRLPRGLYRPYVVSACKKLFVISSLNDRSVYEYESERRAWKEKSRMPYKCEGGSALSVDEWVYVVGGKERRCVIYYFCTDK